MPDLFNLDIKQHLPILEKAISLVIGEKYAEIMKEKFDESIYIYYCNHDGIFGYAEHLLETKNIELCLKFIASLGIDISKYVGMNTRMYDYEEFSGIIKNLMGSAEPFEQEYYLTGIHAFKEPSPFGNNFALSMQIHFINDYFFSGKKVITEENYDLFKTTEYYKRFASSLNDYLNLFEDLKCEYLQYKAENVKPYLNYVEKKLNRSEYIQESELIKKYPEIKNSMPKKVQRILNEKYPDIKKRIRIFGTIGENFGFNYFSDKAKQVIEYGSPSEKKKIYRATLKYFKCLGLIDEIPLDLDELATNYEIALKKYKDYIPSEYVIDYLNKLEQQIIEKTNGILAYEDASFNRSVSFCDQETKRAISRHIKLTCPFVTAAQKDDKETSALFFTIQNYFSCGRIDGMLIHELIHMLYMIHKNGYFFAGLEKLPYSTSGVKPNPYDKNYRLKERMNEALTDIIKERVLFILHHIFGAYLYENKDCTNDLSIRNTSTVIRRLLEPFVNEYLDDFSYALLEEGSLDSLYNKVGADNLEHLNDIINYVDNLVRYLNLEERIVNSDESSLFYKFYLDNVEKVMSIYDDMKINSLNKELKKKP